MSRTRAPTFTPSSIQGALMYLWYSSAPPTLSAGQPGDLPLLLSFALAKTDQIFLGKVRGLGRLRWGRGLSRRLRLGGRRLLTRLQRLRILRRIFQVLPRLME